MAKAAYSIREFCEAYGLCRQTLYNLQKEGKAPRLMRVGRKVLISTEAIADWQAEREAEAV